MQLLKIDLGSILGAFGLVWSLEKVVCGRLGCATTEVWSFSSFVCVLGGFCNILSYPSWGPEVVRLLQPNAPQPITLLRPFILGGLLPVGIEPPTWPLTPLAHQQMLPSLATPPRAPEAVRLLQPNAPQPITLLRPFILGGLLIDTLIMILLLP